MIHCLRWHEDCEGNDCGVPLVDQRRVGRWGMTRNDFITSFVLEDKYLSSGVIEEKERKSLPGFAVHLIHPEDWDYIGEAGV